MAQAPIKVTNDIISSSTVSQSKGGIVETTVAAATAAAATSSSSMTEKKASVHKRPPPSLITTLKTNKKRLKLSPGKSLVQRTHSPHSPNTIININDKNVNSCSKNNKPNYGNSPQSPQQPSLETSEVFHRISPSHPTTTSASSMYDVRTVAPTIKGVQEATDIMLEKQLLAIPTETVYMLCTTYCGLSTEESDERSNYTNHSSSLNQLMDVSKQNQKGNQGSHGVHVLVQSIKEIENSSLFKFKPKAYALKPAPNTATTTSPQVNPQQEYQVSHQPSTIIPYSNINPFGASLSSAPPCNTYQSVATGNTPIYQNHELSGAPTPNTTSRAVPTAGVIAFHEGREVLKRLSSRVWPGPVPIYLRNTTAKNNTTTTTLPGCIMHMLPGDNDNLNQYVGLQCPSHPLASRVLKETSFKARQSGSDDDDDASRGSFNYARRSSNISTVSTCSSSSNDDTYTSFSKSESLAIGVPLYCHTKHDENGSNPVYSTKASDVCMTFLDDGTDQQVGQEDRERTVLHVLNGEDKREIFTVPTCQYAKPCDVSLWIDDNKRLVHIFGSASSAQGTEINEKSILRALLQTSPGSQEQVTKPAISSASLSSTTTPEERISQRTKHRNRVIYSVLRKWKVIDHRIKIQ